MRFGTLVLASAAVVALLTVQALPAQKRMVYAASGTSKFVNFPGLPDCFKGSVQNGDPTKGASVILSKIPAGCVIPWHWHTPTEQLIMVAGRAKMEMKDGPPATLRPGDYASLPSKHVHQFTCRAECTFFIITNAAFDIHYVDATGREISLAEAQRPRKVTR